MNKQEIEKTLNTHLAGKKFDDREVNKLLQELWLYDHKDLIAKGYLIDCYLKDKRSKYFDLIIYNHNEYGWKRYTLIVIKVEKTRDWKNDYYFKHAQVCFNYRLNKDDFDLVETLNKIEEDIEKTNDKRQQEFDEMLVYYNQIKTLLGDKYDNVMKYIRLNGYSLERGELER